MSYRLIETSRPIALFDGEEPTIGAADTNDLISTAASERVDVIAVSTERLDPEFFRLASGVAGELVGKLNQYHLVFAVIGDVTDHERESRSFAGFVAESRRRRSLLIFADDVDALSGRLETVPTFG